MSPATLTPSQLAGRVLVLHDGTRFRVTAADGIGSVRGHRLTADGEGPEVFLGAAQWRVANLEPEPAAAPAPGVA